MRRGLAIRLEPRGCGAARRHDDGQGGPTSALAQPDAVRPGLGARATDDVDADVLVVVSRLEVGGHPSAVEERHTAARHNTLLDRGAHRMHGVADPVLAFLHLDLRGAADMVIPHAGRPPL